MTQACSRHFLAFCLFSFVSCAVFAQDPAFLTEVPGSEQGFGIFQERCMACHGRVEEAPSPAALRTLSAQRIHTALTEGAMQIHARDLSEQDIRRVAEAVSGELLLMEGVGAADTMPNQCSASPAFNAEAVAWNGWGLADNARHQSVQQAGLSAQDLPALELRWAFGYAGGVSAFGQPTVVDERLFVGSDNGYIYSLDALSGCAYWSFRPEAAVRSSISIGPVSGFAGVTQAAYFGDLKANLYAVDTESGRLLWKRKADTHLAARITGSVVLHEGVLYVPMSAWEEGAGRAQNYPCCSFRGSVAAYDANSGARLWRTYTIAGSPEPRGENSAGVMRYGPAGAAVWNTPVIDAENRRLYFGTGNAYTEPAPVTSDAVMALDMDNGSLLWSYQTQKDDAFMVGCAAVASDNCPQTLGPDNDVPASLMLASGPGGIQVIAATRTDEVLSLSPDGTLNWQRDISDLGSGLIWGGSHDGEQTYFGLSGGGLLALSLADGNLEWFQPLGVGPNGSVTTSLDGAVLVGSLSGMLSAVSTDDGAVLWQVDTARDFETVNDVSAHGGSMMSAAGVVAANGMLYVSSGYQVIYGNPGNVLLAFGLEP